MSRFVLSKKRDLLSNNRNIQGALLIELLVAVLVLSFLLAGLMQGLSQMHTQTTAPQNQVIATSICQELFDIARNQSYAVLLAAADGTYHQVLINRQTNGQLATGQPAYITQPLMLDLSSGLGATYSTQGQDCQFRGTCQQKLDDLGGGQLRLTVQVTWPNETGPGTRSMEMDTRLFQNGIIN